MTAAATAIAGAAQSVTVPPPRHPLDVTAAPATRQAGTVYAVLNAAVSVAILLVILPICSPSRSR